MKTAFGKAASLFPLLQPCVFGFGLLQDGDVTVSVFPEGQEISVCCERSHAGGIGIFRVMLMCGAQPPVLLMENGLSWPAPITVELGLLKLPIDEGAPVRIATGPFLDPVWSPRGDLIVYCGPQLFTFAPLLAVHPDGTEAKLPEIRVRREGVRARFLPDGTGLVYMLGSTLAEQDFWLLDISSMRSWRLTQLKSSAVMRAFDITPDSKPDRFRPIIGRLGDIADRRESSSAVVLRNRNAVRVGRNSAQLDSRLGQ